jgi:hypothetical protein
LSLSLINQCWLIKAHNLYLIFSLFPHWQWWLLPWGIPVVYLQQ